MCYQFKQLRRTIVECVQADKNRDCQLCFFLLCSLFLMSVCCRIPATQTFLFCVLLRRESITNEKKNKNKNQNKETTNIGLQGYLRATQERLLQDSAFRILYLQPCISNFTLHTPAFTPLTTHFTLRASQFQTSHLRVQISHLTHHNSRLTHSTSHLTRHILWLHFRPHTSQARAGTLFLYMVAWL